MKEEGRKLEVRTDAEPPYLVGENGIFPLQIAFYLIICVSPEVISYKSKVRSQKEERRRL
ncbi:MULTISPECIES: hypothetical protein [Okeania]|uniref:Uncharacterized protein n=1 Tax=Okeania hirsuta TaxID=1458930 RepID=A0A3N6PS55_9CYAN|nr:MULTISPECIES: hypothetical protein [Okeania]NET23248.1 hypothetical protein [Okeania sp. SIO1H5]NET96992.1 hypothetical protein [Okeania sp. SIO1H2]RQH04780.1 hypothetical protein D4Z78_31080 [Okeania hirsuta]RQH25950.1 hypothetical protein D5R40_28815 [Okeania hirsuta]